MQKMPFPFFSETWQHLQILQALPNASLMDLQPATTYAPGAMIAHAGSLVRKPQLQKRKEGVCNGPQPP